MSYYDQIAKQCHKATGYKGKTFKELVLNDILLRKLPEIKGRSLLELGAGNGYFLSKITIPGSESLRLPVTVRTLEIYLK